MNRFPIFVFSMALGATPLAAWGDAPAPDALSVGQEGDQKLCEKLAEDAHIRILRCIFPPGAVQTRHSHPGTFNYALSGDKIKVEDAKGTREVNIVPGRSDNAPPNPWHEVTNTGNSTFGVLIVKKKYEPVPGNEQAAGK